MTDPKQQQPEPDELDLDAETVKDLEPDEETADEIRGGRAGITGTRCDNCTGKLSGCVS